MIPSELKDRVINTLTNKLDNDVKIINIQFVGGGCINSSFKITTNQGDFFLKYNDNSLVSLFDVERKGLDLLREKGDIYIPDVIGSGKDFLLLEFIDSSLEKNDFWEDFGYRLSNLHKCSNDLFGLEYDNFIGSLYQSNNQSNNWIDFFIDQRIRPQLAIQSFPADFLSSFDRLFLNLDKLFPDVTPSLVHGDLWNGNYMVYNNQPVLIDPALYFGFREMDIAMTKLFGGFSNRFYIAYHENYPLDDGWEDRLDICNLYPLLVHVNLFGGSYYSQVRDIVNRFS